MKKETMKYEGKIWDVKVNTTEASVDTMFTKEGVVRKEHAEMQDHPEVIKKFLVGKKFKLLHAHNIKKLCRETVTKGSFAKFRETATLQAEGIDGEGTPILTDEADEHGDNTVSLQATPTETKKAKVKEAVRKSKAYVYALVTAGVALLVAGAVALWKYAKN